MRVTVAVAVACLSLVAVTNGKDAAAAIRKSTSIAAQPLAPALRTLAKERDVQLVYRSDLVDEQQTAGAAGDLTLDEALTQLLSGTGLTFRYLDNDAVTIVPVPAGNSVAASRSSAQGDSDLSGTNFEEVIVTAQKRAERLQDVPVPVTAISADTLVEQNQLRLQDYYTKVPGLSFTPSSTRGEPLLSIRGLTTKGGNPTVGIVVDDVPYGSSSSYAGGSLAPDLDPSDLARVEVLRGPQGTLYGASSIGGLLKYVTVDPSTEKLDGRLQVALSGVNHSGKSGYTLRGAINVPLSESWAVRASAFNRRDPGYIDDPALRANDLNGADVEGGHLSALWRPSATASLKLSALVQQLNVHGSSQVHSETAPFLADPPQPLGDWQQSALIDTGWYKRDIEIYSATFNAEWGDLDFTSVSGYGVTELSDSFDFTSAFGPYTQDVFGVVGTPVLDQIKTTKWTQEARLSAAIGQRIEWVFGLFYTDEISRTRQQIPAIDPVTGAAVGEWFRDDFPTTFEEYAAFANLTFQLTDQLDVQIGGRESRNRQTYSEIDEGPYDEYFLGLPSPVINEEVVTKDDSFTYAVTPRLKVSPDLMVYARLATGYRVGGPNPTSTVFGLPPHFKPDKTRNYEIGVKGYLLNRVLSFDASVYYIDWKDIQLSLNQPVSFAAYFANVGQAKSQGVELAVEARPSPRLTIAASTSWNDAELTDDFPADASSFGGSGDRLPISARFSGNLSVTQEFPVTATVTGFAGGSLSYVGERKGTFTTTQQRQSLPAYAQVDVSAGVRQQTWTVSAFINNAADRRGMLTGGLGTFTPHGFVYIQPRTVGLTVTKSF